MSVYFIRCGSWVKIGAAKNAYERLHHTQVHNPQKLELVGVVEGTFSQEAAFHRRFKKHRGSGEWFHISGELEQFLETLRAETRSQAELRMQKRAQDEQRKLMRMRGSARVSVSVSEPVIYPLSRNQKPGVPA